MEQIVRNNIIHLEKLQKIGIETFGEKLWKPEIRLLKLLEKEYKTSRGKCFRQDTKWRPPIHSMENVKNR